MKIQYINDEYLNEPLTELLTAVSQIEALNIRLALSRIGGKQKVLETAIEQTAFSIDDKLGKMDEYLSSGDLRGLSVEAHGLKNALAGIGAEKFSEVASSLETASKNGNIVSCKEIFSRFWDLMKAFAEDLNSVFPNEITEGKCAGSKELLNQVVKETIDFLNVFEPDEALGCMSKLENFTFDEETDSLLKYIIKRIKAYKYDEAVFMLKSITESLNTVK